jgi:hypothetical protein
MDLLQASKITFAHVNFGKDIIVLGFKVHCSGVSHLVGPILMPNGTIAPNEVADVDVYLVTPANAAAARKYYLRLCFPEMRRLAAARTSGPPTEWALLRGRQLLQISSRSGWPRSVLRPISRDGVRGVWGGLQEAADEKCC